MGRVGYSLILSFCCSPLCISIFVSETEKAVFQNIVRNIQMDLRHRIILYKQPGKNLKGHIPINLLRNLCIRNLETKRFVVLDADTLPSSNLYATLQSIPSELLENAKNGFVIPTIFLDRGTIINHCRTYEDCFDLYDYEI